MPHDAPSPPPCPVSSSPSSPHHMRVSYGHKCTHYQEVRPTRKSLAAHMRTKHTKCSDTARFIGMAPVCPVCCIRFSTRTRLLAHLSETRSRGKRSATCGSVVRAGLVRKVSDEIFSRATECDRVARSKARKRGCTQPLAAWPAKRLKCGGSLVAAACEARKRLLDLDPSLLPANAVQWELLKPTKRLKKNTNLDDLIALGSIVVG